MMLSPMTKLCSTSTCILVAVAVQRNAIYQRTLKHGSRYTVCIATESETTHACASLAPRACSRRYSRGSAPSRQTDTRADSHALAIWLTSQTYCFVIMHVCVLFGGLFLASPLPLSPDCAPTRTPVRARVPRLAPPELLFKRIPAYALLEHLFKRALARASACASLHIEVLPAAGAA